MRILFAIIRVAVAAAIVAAIVGQLQLSVSVWTAADVSNIGINFTNFFSFFTILSNVFSVFVLLIGAYFLIARKGGDPQWFTIVRGSVVTYMVVTGVVYNLLLRNVELPQGTTLPWSNEILHVVAPVWLLLDWLLVPGRTELVWRTIWTIIVFPLVWVVYTMIRGPITPNELTGAAYWYPYPFLDPNTSPNGYLSVAFYMILITMVIAVTAAGVIWVSKRKPILKSE